MDYIDIQNFNPIIGLILTNLKNKTIVRSINFNPIIGLILTLLFEDSLL